LLAQAHLVDGDVFQAVQNGDLQDAGEFLNRCGKRRRVPAGSSTIVAAGGSDIIPPVAAIDEVLDDH
jgi:hypothetical protein